MSEGSWGPDPISTELLRDSGPWVGALPTLVQALNDPRGSWSPPPAPWTPGAREGNALADAIAYWAPLTTLTWGVLGWARPDLGVQRWVAAGRPTNGPHLMVLDRWWGEDALAVAAWMQSSDYPQGYSRTIHERTGTGVVATPDTTAVRARPEWHDMLDGGTPCTSVTSSTTSSGPGSRRRARNSVAWSTTRRPLPTGTRISSSTLTAGGTAPSPGSVQTCLRDPTAGRGECTSR